MFQFRCDFEEYFFGARGLDAFFESRLADV
jgi:hypothetical protein